MVERIKRQQAAAGVRVDDTTLDDRGTGWRGRCAIASRRRLRERRHGVDQDERSQQARQHRRSRRIRH